MSKVRSASFLVLFLIGTSMSLSALRTVGWRTVAMGLTLWLFISAASLLAIRCLHLAA
jgi:Kef-type K+ transport system membrane component KefB